MKVDAKTKPDLAWRSSHELLIYLMPEFSKRVTHVAAPIGGYDADGKTFQNEFAVDQK